MKTRIHSILFAALLACAAADAAAQTIYKEVDGEGHTTFTDRPPASKVIAPRRGGKVDASEAARRLKQARVESALGEAPGPGELNTGSGVQTVNHRYWQRQIKLRLNVERALRRSNETQRVQVASR